MPGSHNSRLLLSKCLELLSIDIENVLVSEATAGVDGNFALGEGVPVLAFHLQSHRPLFHQLICPLRQSIKETPTWKCSLPTSLNIQSRRKMISPSSLITLRPVVVPCSNSILCVRSYRGTSHVATRSAIFGNSAPTEVSDSELESHQFKGQPCFVVAKKLLSLSVAPSDHLTFVLQFNFKQQLLVDFSFLPQDNVSCLYTQLWHSLSKV